jgi:hypothetical protein
MNFNSKVAVDLLHSLFSCNLTEVTHLSELKIFNALSRPTAAWTTFQHCRRRAEGTQVTFQKCLDNLSKVCLKSKVKVAKVLRMSTDLAEVLLRSMKNLVVVYLTRDPRGTISSRLRTNPKAFQHPNVSDYAQSLCTKMQYDVEQKNILEHKFPGRVLSLVYEQVKETVQNDFSKLYTLLNLTHVGLVDTLAPPLQTNTVSKAVKQNRNAHTQGDWITHADWNIVRIIDKQCANVYSLLGYNQLTHLTIEE